MQHISEECSLSYQVLHIGKKPVNCSLKCKPFDVAVSCCETDREHWTGEILERLETIHKKKVFSIHRDFEIFAGRSLYDLYLQLYRESQCFIFHITKFFLEDVECIQLQLELLLTFIQEKEISVNLVLIIHGDRCDLSFKVTKGLSGADIHDWVMSTDNEKRVKGIIDWLSDTKRLPKFTNDMDSSDGHVYTVLL